MNKLVEKLAKLLAFSSVLFLSIILFLLHSYIMVNFMADKQLYCLVISLIFAGIYYNMKKVLKYFYILAFGKQ